MEPKPCPFCGGEAKLVHIDYDGNREWGVFCVNDLNAEYSHGHFIDNYATAAEAIEAWNTRAERTCELNGTISWEWHTPSTTFYTHSLSCGHNITTTEQEPPNYCEECGAKVVE